MDQELEIMGDKYDFRTIHYEMDIPTKKAFLQGRQINLAKSKAALENGRIDPISDSALRKTFK